MKINGENLLDEFQLLHLLLGTINTHSNLFVNCILLARDPVCGSTVSQLAFFLKRNT